MSGLENILKCKSRLGDRNLTVYILIFLQLFKGIRGISILLVVHLVRLSSILYMRVFALEASCV